MRSLPILMFSLSSAALGQSAGMITGTVLDLGGDKVANAPIQVTNTVTKAVYKATSSGNGSYTLPELPAGTYAVSVSAPGFNPYTQPNIVVASGQAVRLDIHITDYQLRSLGNRREFRIDLVFPLVTPSGPLPLTPD